MSGGVATAPDLEEARGSGARVHPRFLEGLMPSPRLVALSLLMVFAACSAPTPGKLWEESADFDAFMADVEFRLDSWQANYAADLPADLLERAQAVDGSWRILAVTEDWCSDSANTMPFLAHLASGVEGLEFRVVSRAVGASLMAAHPTPDGREAIPTVVLLDSDGDEVGAWVERPAELQEWWIENPDGLGEEEQVEQKIAWYTEDGGATTLAEVVDLLEKAEADALTCAAEGG